MDKKPESDDEWWDQAWKPFPNPKKDPIKFGLCSLGFIAGAMVLKRLGKSFLRDLFKDDDKKT